MASKSLSSLPQEILDKVLDIVVEELSRRDASSLTLVCRSFSYRLQAKLFRIMTINKPSDCAVLTEQHHSSPRLGSLVRHITMSHWDRPGADVHGWSRLSELLQTCSNVASIFIQDMDLDLIPGIQKWHEILPSVEQVSLSRCQSSYSALNAAVLQLPSLTGLTIARTSLTGLQAQDAQHSLPLRRLSISPPNMLPSASRTILGELLGNRLPHLVGLTVELTFDEDNSLAGQLVRRVAKNIEFLRIHTPMLLRLPETSPLFEAIASANQLRELHLATFAENAGSDNSDIRILERLNAPELHTISIKYRLIGDPSPTDPRWNSIDQILHSARFPSLAVVHLTINSFSSETLAVSILERAMPQLMSRKILQVVPGRLGWPQQ